MEANTPTANSRSLTQHSSLEVRWIHDNLLGYFSVTCRRPAKFHTTLFTLHRRKKSPSLIFPSLTQHHIPSLPPNLVAVEILTRQNGQGQQVYVPISLPQWRLNCLAIAVPPKTTFRRAYSLTFNSRCVLASQEQGRSLQGSLHPAPHHHERSPLQGAP
jgi:hypothetical protein